MQLLDQWRAWRAHRADVHQARALYRHQKARWDRYEGLRRRLVLAGHHPSLAGPAPSFPDPRPTRR